MKYLEDPDRIEYNSDISIQEIRDFFIKYRNNHSLFSIFEFGIDNYRFDLLRIHAHNQNIRIFEFKSSRQDFLSDNKWQNYLQYCHTLTFVCAREIILKNDLPAGIGLMWIFKWRWRGSKIWHYSSEFIRRPRKRPVQIETINRIAFMLLQRTRFRKDDIF